MTNTNKFTTFDIMDKSTRSIMGRPRVYDDPNDMLENIIEYFDLFIPDDDKPVVSVLGTRPTVTGLSLHLGFSDRKSLYEYRDKYEDFSSIIKKALTLVEMEYENMLLSKACTGAIFALKNMGWKDKTETENKTKHEFNGDPFQKIRDNNNLNESDK